jgi:hypothetical protein
VKKQFEMPEAIVVSFEKKDILTLSAGDSSTIPSVKW